MNTWIKRLFFLTVFLTGAAVLIVEVSAVRLLAPYFGASLYVLSSVLSVILFALSVGYYFGGKFSDKFPYHIPLYIIITIAGLMLLGLTLFAQYLLPAMAPNQPLLVGPLFFSIVLFFIPAFMLGADSPYVIKLLSLKAKQEEQGQLVGATFFWSTAGSITGSIASGFFLIPTFGLKETISGTAVLLIIFGITIGLLIRKISKQTGNYDSRNNINLKTPIIVTVLLTIIFCVFIFKPTNDDSVLYEADGYYSNIKIFDGQYDEKQVRFLKRDTNSSSAVFLNSNEGLVYPYTQFLYFYPELNPDAKNFLMLGGGAYTMPREVNKMDTEMQIDVVEIEPSLYDLAIEYFDLPRTDKIQNHNLDVRAFLSRTDEKYDVVFLDTFSTGHFVPPHLVTKEFFTLLQSRLSDNGIVIINFIGSQSPSSGRSLTGSFTKTIESVFSNYIIFTTRDNNLQAPQNLMYIIRNNDTPVSLSNLEDKLIKTPGRNIPLSDLQVEVKRLIKPADKILTDNDSPVEVLILKERFAY